MPKKETWQVVCLDCGRDPNGPTRGSGIIVSGASRNLALEIYKDHRSLFPGHKVSPPEKET